MQSINELQAKKEALTAEIIDEIITEVIKESPSGFLDLDTPAHLTPADGHALTLEHIQVDARAKTFTMGDQMSGVDPDADSMDSDEMEIDDLITVLGAVRFTIYPGTNPYEK